MTHSFFALLRRTSLPGVLLLASASVVAADNIQPLPALAARLNETSVSGLSSGAFMAVQFSVAYSSILKGVGAVAGGPYYCAGVGGAAGANRFFENATTQCMTPLAKGPSAEDAVAFAKKTAASGDIDPLSALAKLRVYLFSGAADSVVTTKVVDQTQRFYQLAGVPEKQITYDKTVNAGHAMITNIATDTACAKNAAPFINNCNFMQSHTILKAIYGDLKAPASKLSGKFVRFDQQPFISRFKDSSMAPSGEVYIPGKCTAGGCRVHVVFHGCLQEEAVIGDKYYRGTGYNEMADSNGIIVLYPQIKMNKATNPQGCWDFWGYSSGGKAPDFYKKSAVQMSAVKAMIDRLAAPRQ